jgi:hypothetical protein
LRAHFFDEMALRIISQNAGFNAFGLKQNTFIPVITTHIAAINNMF